MYVIGKRMERGWILVRRLMQQGKSGVVAKGSFPVGLLRAEPKGLLEPVNQDVF